VLQTLLGINTISRSLHQTPRCATEHPTAGRPTSAADAGLRILFRASFRMRTQMLRWRCAWDFWPCWPGFQYPLWEGTMRQAFFRSAYDAARFSFITPRCRASLSNASFARFLCRSSVSCWPQLPAR